MHRKVAGEGMGQRWNAGKVTGHGERRACYASIRAHICRPRSSESVPWKMRVRRSDGGRVPRSLGTEVANAQDVPGVPSSHDPGGEVPARSLPPKGDAVALGRRSAAHGASAGIRRDARRGPIQQGRGGIKLRPGRLGRQVVADRAHGASAGIRRDAGRGCTGAPTW